MLLEGMRALFTFFFNFSLSGILFHLGTVIVWSILRLRFLLENLKVMFHFSTDSYHMSECFLSRSYICKYSTFKNGCSHKIRLTEILG